MSDPLAHFRKKPIVPQLAAVSGGVTAAPEAYQAYAAKDKVERLRLRPAMAPYHAARYEFLLDVSSDGPFGTNFVLMFTFMLVFVRGKNLQPVIAALELGKADFLQEYHRDLWPTKPGENEPIIESLQVRMHDERLLQLEPSKGK